MRALGEEILNVIGYAVITGLAAWLLFSFGPMR